MRPSPSSGTRSPSQVEAAFSALQQPLSDGGTSNKIDWPIVVKEVLVRTYHISLSKEKSTSQQTYNRESSKFLDVRLQLLYILLRQLRVIFKILLKIVSDMRRRHCKFFYQLVLRFLHRSLCSSACLFIHIKQSSNGEASRGWRRRQKRLTSGYFLSTGDIRLPL